MQTRFLPNGQAAAFEAVLNLKFFVSIRDSSGSFRLRNSPGFVWAPTINSMIDRRADAAACVTWAALHCLPGSQFVQPVRLYWPFSIFSTWTKRTRRPLFVCLEFFLESIGIFKSLFIAISNSSFGLFRPPGQVTRTKERLIQEDSPRRQFRSAWTDRDG